MKTRYGHLTYCSNIHPGAGWEEHFGELKANLPYIRREVAGELPLAIGLRLANEASIDLEKPEMLLDFKQWLNQNQLYTFCFNGFPYGSFHHDVVKDQVHAPDWTTRERVDYTKRLFRILSRLLPEGMHGGVSTPPLSYRHWWTTGEALEGAKLRATNHILEVVDFLIGLKEETGTDLHLDIEPEPDGILDNGSDFFEWYLHSLLPAGAAFFEERRGYSAQETTACILNHVQLCYDVCHFAISYESPREVFERLKATGIRVGRIQVSSALRIDLRENREAKLAALAAFNEPVYLHQVVARRDDGRLERFSDLGLALKSVPDNHVEWRVHFHVPLFIDSYGLLEATQNEILEVLALQREYEMTSCLEIETYTWGVLPKPLQVPLSDSIVRELNWVGEQMFI